jgi:hypothetical protein
VEGEVWVGGEEQVEVEVENWRSGRRRELLEREAGFERIYTPGGSSPRPEAAMRWTTHRMPRNLSLAASSCGPATYTGH